MVIKRSKAAGLILALVGIFLLSACSLPATNNIGGQASKGTIPVVAAENFYGDIVSQIGGKYVSVTNILSDPNVDPHTYESNVNQVKAVAKARLIVANGGGYDDWMDKLISSTPDESRRVLKGFDLATVKLPNNEHVWYSPVNARTIATAIADNLKAIDARHAAAYETNLQRFKSESMKIDQKLAAIKARYAGTPIGLTETILLYQTGSMGLNVLTPAEFQKAMAEDNDPPASTVITTENQITRRQIKVLIYNQQTQSTIITRLQSTAQAQHIPTIAVTETMPGNQTYQSWMIGQLNALEQGLGQNK
ncbi:metal ABC transporter solute-binding protein, Zn/Mn family [Dictyobacter aurantiacus]|uniref:ABC transporter substrate-binding protein n=1 Tax=Dictyobacter aurantiacus TaxID=1936993 RepID=A0A401ZPJ7_9CHLR|nr:zinc ABC transporter substrate-binding protein [Dictyobacter aurantiacus]GCE08714.1 ABC transporter substrate-binding protein [Dictyobacter aurantiacus]